MTNRYIFKTILMRRYTTELVRRPPSSRLPRLCKLDSVRNCRDGNSNPHGITGEPVYASRQDTMADTQPFDPHAPDADPAKPVNTRTEVNGQVTLLEYDRAWPDMFQREQSRIRSALGSRALGVEHIGSTAVPGLLAKPCIDMLLVVADAGDDDTYIPDLEAAGYVLRISDDDDGDLHRVFKGLEINLNLHVWSAGSPNVSRHIDFRDWLRSHPEDRDHYAAAKRKLAGQHWRYMQDYSDAKDKIVRQITSHMTHYERD